MSKIMNSVVWFLMVSPSENHGPVCFVALGLSVLSSVANCAEHIDHRIKHPHHSPAFGFAVMKELWWAIKPFLSLICFGLTGQPVTFFILVGSEPVRVLSFVTFPANNIRLLAGAYQLMYSPKETLQLRRRFPVWSFDGSKNLSPFQTSSATSIGGCKKSSRNFACMHWTPPRLGFDVKREREDYPFWLKRSLP
jgi:hypothetical protein